MRKTKLLLVALLAMLGSSVYAQSWTAPTITGEAPVDGSQYKVMNVGANKFLAMGQAWFGWSTTAIMSDNGINFTMKADGDNWKFIRTGEQGVFTSGNGITGDAMHVDNTAHTYGITQMPNGYYHIHDANGNDESPCWGYNSSFHATGVVAHADATAEGWMCDWAFVTEASSKLFDAQLKLYNLLNQAQAEGADTDEAAAVYNNSSATVEELNAACEALKSGIFTNRIKDASAENPANITDLVVVNPSFETGNTTGWTYEASNDHGAKDNSNSTYTINNADGNYVFNIWSSGNAISQTINNLPNGSYKLMALIATDAGKQVQLNANTESVKVDASSEGKGKGVDGELEFSVLDGTATIGAEGVDKYWYKVDNFRLYYLGALADFTAFQEALDQAVADAEAILNEKMCTAALSGLQDAISTYKGQTYSSEEDYNTAIQAVKDATNAANTSINSYKVIAAGSIPDNSLNGWVCETFVNGQDVRFQVNTWSGEGNSDGSNMKTPFIENWTPKGNFLGVGKVYYKLEGLEPGESYYAQALVRSYNEASSDAPNGPNFFINDVEVDLSEAGTTFTYNGMSGIYATLGDQATVGEDGTLTLGVKIAEDRNYNWVAFKSVSIKSMSDALAQAVANAEALEGKIPESAYSDLSSIVSSCSDATIDNINTINEAVEQYAAMIAPYADFKTLKAIAEDLVSAGTDNTSGQSDLSDEISTQSSNVESAETADDINTAYAALKEEMTDYAISSNPVGEGQKFNMTFMLTNPDLTGLPTWQKAEGWYTEQEDGNSQVMTNGNATSSDGTKTVFFEYWNNPPVGNDLFALYLTVTLPAGTYNMSCYAFAQYEQEGKHDNIPNGVYFYANDVQGSAVNNARLSEQSIEFVNEEEQEVKIGLKPVEGNGNTWMGIGYVQLFKVPANTIELDEDVAYEPESKAGTVTLKKTIQSGWNTVVLPFGVSAEDVADQFGAGTLYKYTGDDEEGILNFEEATAIEPHTPYLFNSTGTPESEMTFAGVTISTGTPATAGTSFDFVGTYEPITSITANDYVLGASAFVKAKGGNALKAFRAYIQGKEESEARELLISIDGVITAIETIDGKKVNSNGAIYNLAGQKVKKAQKGIFIQDGKKILK